MESAPRRPYPGDCTDDEWAFVAPCLALLRPDAPQRRYDPREVFDALRRIVRAGAPWRRLPTDFPPWGAVYRQGRRWIDAGRFADVVHELRAMLRRAAGRADDPTAAVIGGRTPRGTPEGGARAGYDGRKRAEGSKPRPAVDTPGHLLALRPTPADEQDRARVGALAAAVQEATRGSVEIAWVDQGHTGAAPAAAAAAHGIELVVVQLPEAKRGFVLLPRRRVAERSFARASRFRRLARDYERLPPVVEGRHFLAFACPMLRQPVDVAAPSP